MRTITIIYCLKRSLSSHNIFPNLVEFSNNCNNALISYNSKFRDVSINKTVLKNNPNSYFGGFDIAQYLVEAQLKRYL